MPLNTIVKIYRRRVVGNPWLYHAKWWVKDVAESSAMRAKIEAASLRDVAVASARNIPFTLRIARDLVSSKIRDIRSDRQELPRP
jgi:hypothetical protein